MNDYAQPEFYRFNEDSLRLVIWIAGLNLKPSRMLDLGSGSGVIGIELANRLHPEVLTLLELQEEFLPFLSQNCKDQLLASSRVEIIHSSFGRWEPNEKYDLIVSNPPYFLPGQGKTSSDFRKHLARTFSTDDWTVLFQKTKSALTKDGRSFFVVRGDEKLLSYLRSIQEKIKVTRQDHLCFIELSGLDVD